MTKMQEKEIDDVPDIQNENDEEEQDEEDQEEQEDPIEDDDEQREEKVSSKTKTRKPLKTTTVTTKRNTKKAIQEHLGVKDKTVAKTRSKPKPKSRELTVAQARKSHNKLKQLDKEIGTLQVEGVNVERETLSHAARYLATEIQDSKGDQTIPKFSQKSIDLICRFYERELKLLIKQAMLFTKCKNVSILKPCYFDLAKESIQLSTN